MVNWKTLGIKTYKEDPSDAEVPSHKLLVRAGLIKKVASGIYNYSPLFLRSMRKLEAIIREELDGAGMAELLMPMVQPKSLWEESKRWGYPDLQTFTTKTQNEFCLGPTHEEVITDYVRNDITSYKELPVTFYQIQNKYRDEIRPRFGLMRGREFLMKDAYSFDATQDDAHKSYYSTRDAYVKIFDRLGLDYRVVKADGGSIGGSLTEEFQVLAQVGEDELLVSDGSDYAANIEICPRSFKIEALPSVLKDEEKSEIPTPGLRTIEDLAKSLSVSEDELVKTMFFEGQYPNGKLVKFTVLLRGSDQVNSTKIKNNLGFAAEPRMLEAAEVQEFVGASPGSCGPVGVEGNIYMDQFLESYKNMIVGANKDDFHLRGVCPERDFKVKEVFDLSSAKDGDPSPDGKGVLKSIRGVEVGHIFYLGTKYSKSMKAQFSDAKGKNQFFEMGCYGLGVTRTLQAAVEQSHDKDGIVWPKGLSPFDVHICTLDATDEMNDFLKETVKALEAEGLSVFLDDRGERPGVKFKDADLMGFPLRLTIGQKGFERGSIETFIRKTGEKSDVPIGEAVSRIKEIYNGI